MKYDETICSLFHNESSCFRDYWKDLLILPILIIKTTSPHLSCWTKMPLQKKKTTTIRMEFTTWNEFLAMVPTLFQGRENCILNSCYWQNWRGEKMGKEFQKKLCSTILVWESQKRNEGWKTGIFSCYRAICAFNWVCKFSGRMPNWNLPSGRRDEVSPPHTLSPMT